MKINNAIRCLRGGLLATFGLLLLTILPVRASYESTVLNDHPLAYYALDLTIDNGGVATDLSGNTNDANYYNLVASTGPTAYIPNAAYFAGSSAESFVDLSSGQYADILNFGGTITMEAWVESTNVTQGPGDILGKGYDSSINDDELCLRANGGNNYYGGTYDSVNGGASASGGQQTTNWTYLVSTFDGTNWNMYVNGQTVGHNADTVGAINFPDPWAIGTGSADGFSRFFVGNICQVALYTNSLTPTQVKSHYYAGLFGVSSISSSIPLIFTQPQPQAVYPGGTATFRVVDVSASAVTNQWLKNGVPLAGQTSATLTVENVQAVNAANYSVISGNANGVTNSVAVSLSLLMPSGNSLEWTTTANGNDGTWNTDSSADWLNLSDNAQTVFNPGDQVLFDDTMDVPTNITVSGVLSPSSIVVDSSTNDFTFSGSGSISGTGSLLKEGSSTLTFESPVGCAVTIAGGTLYAGNNSLDSAASITITNGSTLDMGGATFNNDNPITVSGSGINGEGALFNSYNDYPAEVLNITLAGATTFGGTARWDLASGAQISGPYDLTLDWSHDGGYGQWTGITIGANVPQINLANGGNLGMSAMDTSCQNPATLLDVSTNDQLIFYGGGFNGSVNLYNGAQMIVYSGNVNLAGSSIHVYSGATMYLYAAGIAMTGNQLTFENGAALQTYYNGGLNPIANQVTLNGVAHFVLGDHSESFSNVISGVGGFVLDQYNQSVVLSAVNTYSGPTIIGSSGNSPNVALTGNASISDSSLIFFGGADPTVEHIDVSGRTDKTLTLASGQTLQGVGSINGNLVVAAGATVSPGGTNTTIGITTGGNPVGALTASNNITLNGTTIVKLNGSGVNDEIAAVGSITYGGTLNVANISGTPLAVGNSFQLFSAASYSGSFGSINPTTPGTGLAWDTSQLVSNGFLNVVSSGATGPVISSTSVSGGNLIFSGTGGTPNGSFVVFSTTNLAASVWVPVSTNSFNASGGFSVTNALSTKTPQMYFQIN